MHKKLAVSDKISIKTEKGLIEKLSALTDKIDEATEALEEAIASYKKITDVTEASYRIRDDILPKMDAPKSALRRGGNPHRGKILALPDLRQAVVRGVINKGERKDDSLCNLT